MSHIGYCQEHVDWAVAQGGPIYSEGHAYNYTYGPKKDYCFWCGLHRDGTHFYSGNVQEWTKEEAEYDYRVQEGLE